jgi:uncharacterized protein (DUF1330 family)
MKDNKATLVISAILNKANMAELPQYMGAIGPIFMKNGGTPVGRYKGIEQLAGEQGPEIVSIFDFPNAEVIKAMYDSEEFIALADLRGRIFTKLNLTICNGM